MVCSQCGNTLSDNAVVCVQCGKIFQTDIAAQPVSKKQRMIKIISAIVIIVVLFSGFGYFVATIGRSYHPIIDDQPSIGFGINAAPGKIMSNKINGAIEGNDIVFPLEIVTNYRIIRLDDPEGKQTVPILAYITPRGKVVTAMSISESCRSNDFYLEGNNIHCANCPSNWNMESMEAYACCQKYYPDPIPSKVINGQVHIEKNIVQNWRTRL
ncbi:MAG: Fe-S-containing protein [Bacteroidota bacterium]|nr:Fe-S-containing protein [Bacteroidota bacterium]